MKRILYVHGGLLHRGGTEAVMLNYYRNMDKSRVHIDFLVHGFGQGEYDEEVLSAGSQIFHVVPKGENYRENARQIREILRNNSYDAVHAHMDAGNAQVLKIAKQCGVPLRISHSHNTATQTENPLKKLYNSLEKKKIRRYATHLFACSDMAGQWLYGKGFTVIPNAIDTEKFAFDPEKRVEVRQRLKIAPEETVVGHMGRFCYQKNHGQLLRVFRALLQKVPNARLLLVGDGEIKDEIQAKCVEMGIADRVLFTGAVATPADYMQAMDCFVLPSHFEGLPMVMVEAQAAGLPILASDAVTAKSKLTPLVHFLPLQESDEKWAQTLTELATVGRHDYRTEIADKGFDIQVSAQKMQDFYERGGN